MTAEYQREAGKSCLVLTITQGHAFGYQIPMLLQNRIPGMLPVYMQTVDGIQRLCYEVTSYEPLTKRFEAERMNRQTMFQLLLAVNSILEEADRYLLNGNHVVLDPEYIFTGIQEHDICFCYDPQAEEKDTDSLNRIARFILDHIDYEEKEIVEIAYALFQESMKANSSIRDFIQTVTAKRQQESGDRVMETRLEMDPDENAQADAETDQTQDAAENVQGKERKQVMKAAGWGAAEALLIGGCNAGVFAGVLWAEIHLPETWMKTDQWLLLGIAGSFLAGVASAAIHGTLRRWHAEHG